MTLKVLVRCEVCCASSHHMMSGKRKSTIVSIETKLNAIKRFDKGESIKKVAKELGVGKVTLGDWRRKRSEIEGWASQSSSFYNISNRKTM